MDREPSIRPLRSVGEVSTKRDRTGLPTPSRSLRGRVVVPPPRTAVSRASRLRLVKSVPKRSLRVRSATAAWRFKNNVHEPTAPASRSLVSAISPRSGVRNSSTSVPSRPKIPANLTSPPARTSVTALDPSQLSPRCEQQHRVSPR